MCLNILNLKEQIGAERRSLINKMENELVCLKSRRDELNKIIRKLNKISGIDEDEHELHIEFINNQDELLFLRKDISKKQRITKNYIKTNNLPKNFLMKDNFEITSELIKENKTQKKQRKITNNLNEDVEFIMNFMNDKVRRATLHKKIKTINKYFEKNVIGLSETYEYVNTHYFKGITNENVDTFYQSLKEKIIDNLIIRNFLISESVDSIKETTTDNEVTESPMDDECPLLIPYEQEQEQVEGTETLEQEQEQQQEQEQVEGTETLEQEQDNLIDEPSLERSMTVDADFHKFNKAQIDDIIEQYNFYSQFPTETLVICPLYLSYVPYFEKYKKWQELGLIKNATATTAGSLSKVGTNENNKVSLVANHIIDEKSTEAQFYENTYGNMLGKKEKKERIQNADYYEFFGKNFYFCQKKAVTIMKEQKHNLLIAKDKLKKDGSTSKNYTSFLNKEEYLSWFETIPINSRNFYELMCPDLVHYECYDIDLDNDELLKLNIATEEELKTLTDESVYKLFEYTRREFLKSKQVEENIINKVPYIISSSKNQKTSLHLTYHNIFKNQDEFKMFFDEFKHYLKIQGRQINDTDFYVERFKYAGIVMKQGKDIKRQGIDFSICSDYRAMRLIGCSKMTEIRPFSPAKFHEQSTEAYNNKQYHKFFITDVDMAEEDNDIYETEKYIRSVETKDKYGSVRKISHGVFNINSFSFSEIKELINNETSDFQYVVNKQFDQKEIFEETLKLNQDLLDNQHHKLKDELIKEKMQYNNYMLFVVSFICFYYYLLQEEDDELLLEMYEKYVHDIYRHQKLDVNSSLKHWKNTVCKNIIEGKNKIYFPFLINGLKNHKDFQTYLKKYWKQNDNINSYILKGSHYEIEQFKYKTLINQPAIPAISDILKGREKATIEIQSNMMTYKSQSIYKWIEENKDKTILFVTFRITLGDKHKKETEERGLDFAVYSDKNLFPGNSPIQYPHLIVQFDSLYRVRGNYDIVILDEPEYLQQHFDFINKNNKAQVFYNYITFIKECDILIMTDALATNLTTDFVMNLRKDKHKPEDFEIIKNEYKSFNGQDVVLLTSKEQIIKIIDYHLNNNMRVVVPSNVKKFILALIKYFSEKYPERKHKFGYITKEHKDHDDVETWSQFDLFCYSPSISAGNSFNPKHFDVRVCYFKNTSANAMVSSQMIPRVRNAGQVNYIYIEQLRMSLPIYPEQVLEYIENEDKSYDNTMLIRNPINNKIVKDEYYQLYYNNTLLNNLNRVNFENSMVGILKQHGFNVFKYNRNFTDKQFASGETDIINSYINRINNVKNMEDIYDNNPNNKKLTFATYECESDDDIDNITTDEILDKDIKTVNKILSDEEITAILSSKELTFDEFKKLDKRDDKTKDEYNSIIKYNLSTKYNITYKDITISNIKFLLNNDNFYKFNAHNKYYSYIQKNGEIKELNIDESIHQCQLIIENKQLDKFNTNSKVKNMARLNHNKHYPKHLLCLSFLKHLGFKSIKDFETKTLNQNVYNNLLDCIQQNSRNLTHYYKYLSFAEDKKHFSYIEYLLSLKHEDLLTNNQYDKLNILLEKKEELKQETQKLKKEIGSFNLKKANMKLDEIRKTFQNKINKVNKKDGKQFIKLTSNFEKKQQEKKQFTNDMNIKNQNRHTLLNELSLLNIEIEKIQNILKQDNNDAFLKNRNRILKFVIHIIEDSFFIDIVISKEKADIIQMKDYITEFYEPNNIKLLPFKDKQNLITEVDTITEVMGNAIKYYYGVDK